jgi:N,N'-diacetyllegionaminate synthase
MLRGLRLKPEAHHRLQARAAELGVVFFSTAFDLGSIDFLEAMDIPVWKIPSGEITNYPYLARIAGLGRPTILSTGMADLAEIEAALNLLLENGLARDQISILHCNTAYPTPWEDVNLLAMPTLGRAFGCAFGYSDHTPGVEISVAAVALGARVIEKHFTLDKDLPGPDHRASLDPGELRQWVEGCRRVEVALGDGIKRPSASEAKNRDVARKIVVAARPIATGEPFTEANLTVKRAGAGLSPMAWPRLMGRLATRVYAQDEAIDP